ncbi:hypothetical protein [Jonesia quinghaiensis]|uniref:hypothetical protein n=1 Tax=Jonesia quinghaiensis TaxID=262806 RepID=UPI0004259CEB|nr:hypothetical protein [Jonesia quinghaiensis]
MSSLAVALATPVRSAVLPSSLNLDAPRVMQPTPVAQERVVDVVKPGRAGAVTVEYLVLHDIERFSMRRATRTETRQTASLRDVTNGGVAV